MIYITYALVIFFANVIGAIAGMGGGVIIKPILDVIGAHPLIQINFFSSVAVFTMAITSTYKQINLGIHLKKKFVFIISFGAIIGGLLGNTTFNWLEQVIANDHIINQIQVILTILTLLFALGYSIAPYWHFRITNLLLLMLIGMFLGWISTLLGIGGGPINVALLMLCCSFPIKEATVYSIITILFSQFSKILAVIFSGMIWSFDLKTLLFIVPAAAIGGIIGAKYSHVVDAQKVELVYRMAILLVISINLFNSYQVVMGIS
ncbi:sulfite exporter TauE/SafE family protein [Pediococcus ethanolidurans]|uniref:Probable membrane transporter protein n=1 Tax=Pediococcus ethanolidurans TaxID=319653 RepID=A0A0R2K1V1_9LACO|nr:sulfite exporter TauE/SafE family protein [Pediococcus ethanolidurans]KRN83601.1 hypothetical protein IV87_GL000070 [Pediococcus ethanolidurans]GEN94044.1 hypothetical protein PET01_00940 [Pediococcus ethanolidurans]SER03029.1 hypothetical protein SAMN04487973_10197 [Pediococcus ethanolidurans]